MTADLATIDAPPELKTSAAAVVKWSNDNAIACLADKVRTVEHLTQTNANLKTADEYFDPPIKQAHDLHKLLLSRKKVVTDPMEQSKGIDKSKILAFDKAESDKAEAERKRLQAIADEAARKERVAREEEARKQREIQAAAEAKAEQARKEAENANAAERKRLMEIAARAEAKAAAAAEKADDKATEAAMVITPQVSVASQSTAVKGFGTAKIWKATVIDINLVPREFLVIDDKKLQAYAKAMKATASVPGVTFAAVETARSY